MIAAGHLSFVVRPATPDEYAAAGAVTAAGYHADDLLRLPDGSIDEHYLGLLTDAARRAREAELLVAVDADRTVIGTVTWCPPGSPWRDFAEAEDEGEFRMLSVAPTARRRGVAAALVAACLERARAARMRRVLIFSLQDMTGAHALYRGLGFVRVPERDWEPEHGVVLRAFRLEVAGGGAT